jgi:hypothetical protein
VATTRLTRDDDLATATEQALTDLILGNEPSYSFPYIEDEDGRVEVNVIETYSEAMLLTRDKGLVIQLSDGRELHLTITAYGPARR